MNLLINDTAIQQLRNDVEADIVVVLTNGTNGDYQYRRGMAGSVKPEDANAYAIVQICLATNFTFIHEIGHLCEAGHESWTVSFAGNYRAKKFGNEYTIMYQSIENNMMLHWSNPNIFVNGNATGSSTRKNYVALNFNVPIVAAYRGSPSFYVTINGPGSANGGEMLNFQGSYYNHQNPVNTVWEINTGSGYFYAGSGANLSYTMPMESDMQVKLTATDGGGNTDSYIRNVMNNFLGGGCEICAFSDNIDSLQTESGQGKSFPNPSSEFTTLELPKDFSLKQLKIVSYYNKGNVVEIEKYEINKHNIQIDISKWNEGIYLLSVSNGKEKIHFKIIKN